MATFVDIVADRRLLYESERGSKPIKQQEKEGQKLVLVQSVYYFFSPSSLSIPAEVYFLNLVYNTKSTMNIDLRM